MNPIEEMMKKYGVKKIDPCEACTKKTWAECQACPKFEADPVYPPFTPEKQLETIKILSVSRNIEIFHSKSLKYNEFCRVRINDIAHSSVIHKSLYYALAALLNKCFDTFIPAQRQQIKEILEG